MHYNKREAECCEGAVQYDCLLFPCLNCSFVDWIGVVDREFNQQETSRSSPDLRLHSPASWPSEIVQQLGFDRIGLKH